MQPEFRAGSLRCLAALAAICCFMSGDAFASSAASDAAHARNLLKADRECEDIVFADGTVAECPSVEASQTAAIAHAKHADVTCPPPTREDGARNCVLDCAKIGKGSTVAIVNETGTDESVVAAIADAAREAGALVARLPIRRGGGLALRVGYDIALRLGAEIVVTLDADGQHQPEEIPILVKPILQDEADHVNGSRMLGEYERGALIRHVGVHFFSWLLTVLTGQRVTDISSGYRATRADTLRKLILTQDQFWTSEVTIEALRQRARIVEVPVTFLTRRGGESKKPKSMRYAWNFSKAIAKTWLR